MRRFALLAGVTLVLASCGSNTVDSSQVEKGIKNDISSSTAEVKSAKCPDNVKSEDGATFNCEVTFTSGATGKAQVAQSGKRTFTYELVDGSVRIPGSVAAEQIQKSLAQQGAPNATVHCPESIAVKPGTMVTCGVSGPKSAGNVTFTFSAADGTVDPGSVKTS